MTQSVRLRSVPGDAQRPDLPLPLPAISPDELPFPAGEPERGEQWAPAGVPPTGLEFLGCRGSLECWLMPCPSCCRGWVPIVPDGTPDGYRLAAEVGCTIGCAESHIRWWHLWRLGLLPPSAPSDPGRTRRYAAACIRRILEGLPDRPTAEQLRRAAFQIGGWLEAGGLRPDDAAAALLSAARRANVQGLGAQLAEAMTAGRARPGRVPT